MLDGVFTHILDMSLISSVVILVVLLARLALKRMPKVFSYCLWAVVLFRLLCPITASVPTPSVPAMPSVAESYSLGKHDITFSELEKTDVLSQTMTVTQQYDFGDVHRTISFDWWELLVLLGQYVWLAGVLTMGVISLLRFGKLRKKLAESVCLEGNVYIVDGMASPFVMGLICPKIYIPSGLTQQEQQFVLSHERYHIRRLDHIVKALAYVALCLHWFNPLVWVAFILSGRDMEMSCDEAVVRKLDNNLRADYSQLLLRFSTGRVTIAGAPLAFGEGDGGKRIRNLSKWKKPALWASVAAVVGCVLLAIICGLDNEPVVFDKKAETVLDSLNEGELGGVEMLENTAEFRMEEYPGVVFRCDSKHLIAEEKDVKKKLISGMPLCNLFLSDLNGDGRRELCATVFIGSGIIDQRIVVYDYADSMQFELQDRMAYDYYLTVEDGKLVTYRRNYENYKDVTKGNLTLKQRSLTFKGHGLSIAGHRSSPQINVEILKQKFSYIKKDIASYSDKLLNSSRSIPRSAAVEYYISRHENVVDDAVEYGTDIVALKYAKMRENQDVFQYLIAVGELTSNYSGYGEYVYYDPNLPNQLFICTEYRDCDYDSVEDYYRAVCGGGTKAHPDTFILRLDQHGIYRWGEDQNLYNSIVS